MVFWFISSLLSVEASLMLLQNWNLPVHSVLLPDSSHLAVQFSFIATKNYTLCISPWRSCGCCEDTDSTLGPQTFSANHGVFCNPQADDPQIFMFNPGPSVAFQFCLANSLCAVRSPTGTSSLACVNQSPLSTPQNPGPPSVSPVSVTRASTLERDWTHWTSPHWVLIRERGEGITKRIAPTIIWVQLW